MCYNKSTVIIFKNGGIFKVKHNNDHKWQRILPIIKEHGYYVKRNIDQRSVSLHDHAFLELTYITKGRVTHTIDGRTSELTAGDYLMVDYDSLHSYSTGDGTGFDNVDCLFLPKLLDPSLDDSMGIRDLFFHYLIHFNTSSFAENPLHTVFHDDDGSILALIEKIEKENESKSAGYKEIVRCYLIEIFLLTLRRIDGAKAASQAKSIGSYIAKYVSEHFSEEISLSYFAAKLNYSLPYVSKSFKDEYGVSFISYLQNYRIKEASRLLLTTKRSVPEIAELVGYHDHKFFSELFKRITGISALKFRKLNRS